MGKADTITFDKTGTLTYGKLQVSDIISFHEEMDSDYILRMAASAETKSEHPLGKAIVNDAPALKIAEVGVAIVLSVTGILNPTTGALVHNAGSCFVVLIAALLYDRKFDTVKTDEMQSILEVGSEQ